jgi:hypothetical protein
VLPAKGGLRPPLAGLEAVEKVFTAWIWGSGFIAGRTPPGDRVTNRPVTLMEVHFAPHRWQVNGADRHEVLVGSEGLHRGRMEVLGTLLHEAAHGLAQARSIQETSRQGRYHNRRYATLARELGLEVTTVKPIGWSATTVPETTASVYAGQLGKLAAALVLWRRQEHRIGPGSRSRNLLAAACGCGRRIGSPRRPWRRRRSSAAPASTRSNSQALTKAAIDT